MRKGAKAGKDQAGQRSQSALALKLDEGKKDKAE
jgi:hypothetical protein